MKTYFVIYCNLELLKMKEFGGLINGIIWKVNSRSIHKSEYKLKSEKI